MPGERQNRNSSIKTTLMELRHTMSQAEAHAYSLGEEIANSVTHGAGALMALVGLVVLCVEAVRSGGVWQLLGCSVYGASLIACLSFSTLYHAVASARWKPMLRTCDHASIFALIAGTYTPFMLVNLRGAWGWTLLAVIWLAALSGITLRVYFRGRHHRIVVALYLAMGWAVLIATKPMLQHVAVRALWLLAAGGVAFTVGVLFYRAKRTAYTHSVWHGFVLIGAALHFFAVRYAVMP